MKTLFKIFCGVCLVALASSMCAQVPFHKGVNLDYWFQDENVRLIQFTRYSRQEFINIKSLGCDVIRLPINLHFMTNGAPDYTIDPLLFEFLDSAAVWAEEQKIYLILDNHTLASNTFSDPNLGTILTKVWSQMAGHYKGRSSYILYEVLNEPHDITTAQWGKIQQEAINAIRTVDTKHTVIVGGSGWNSYNELQNLPIYSDTNLIYTFHFYDPMIFTHQGADYAGLGPLAGLPFPYDINRMPAWPVSLKGTWGEYSYNNYYKVGTVDSIKKLLDVAIAFKKSRKVSVFCGEFGTYLAPNPDLCLWHDTVRTYLEKNNIPWTDFDYSEDGFGLFKNGSDKLFDYDLNDSLLQALGFNVPVQKTLIIRPDSVGFPVYTDFIESNIRYVTRGGTITLDFYNSNKPNNGNYCIYWGNANLYENMVFQFIPYKDLSKLVADNFALDFMVRGDSSGSGASFDLIFTDVTDQPGSLPWRMAYTINESIAKWDKHWHHVHIPLKIFTEQGAYYNGTWYNPQGKFDWKIIGSFEFNPDVVSLKDIGFWFDNIYVTNMDTAQVRDTSVVKNTTIVKANNNLLPTVFSLAQNFPNPFNPTTTISFSLPSRLFVSLRIFDALGREVSILVAEELPAGIYTREWNATKTSSGVYFYRFQAGTYNATKKLLLLK